MTDSFIDDFYDEIHDEDDQYNNFVSASNNPALTEFTGLLMNSDDFVTELINAVNDLASFNPVDLHSLMVNALDNCRNRLESGVVAKSLFSLYSSELNDYLFSDAFNGMFSKDVKPFVKTGLSGVINYYAASRIKEELGESGDLWAVKDYLVAPGIRDSYSSFVDILGAYFINAGLQIKASSELLTRFEKTKSRVIRLGPDSIISRDEARKYHSGLELNYAVISKAYELMRKYSV